MSFLLGNQIPNWDAICASIPKLALKMFHNINFRALDIQSPDFFGKCNLMGKLLLPGSKGSKRGGYHKI